MVLKTNTGWLVPEMCSDASKLLALIGKKNVGAVFCFVYFHFFSFQLLLHFCMQN